MRKLSLIEMMVDQAAGFKPEPAVRAGAVTLRCPHCARAKQAQTDKSDPPDTAVVEAPCNECIDRPDFEIKYFNAAGVEIGSVPGGG